jgi:hypothetical protein
MYIKIISQSQDFPTYFFNQYVGHTAKVVKKGKTHHTGMFSGKKQPVYWVSTELEHIPSIAVPVANLLIKLNAYTLPKADISLLLQCRWQRRGTFRLA